MKKNIQKFVSIKKLDGDRQMVFGEVYAPGEIDSHGELMNADEIESLAHKFMRKVDLSKVIDVQHSRQPISAYPVESFIAKGQRGYAEDSWVLGVKVEDTDTWSKIKNNEINGFSFDAYGLVKQGAAEIEFYKLSYGMTGETDGHSHAYYIEFDKDGQILKGRSSTVNGHFHEITRGTATDWTNNHRHKFFLEG